MKEFVEFLGSQSPYDRLSHSDLATLARHVEVEFFAQGTVILHEDDAPSESLYVIRTGSVELLDAGVRSFDHLSIGDTFGHMSMLSGMAPAFTVRAVEDTLCYRLPDPRSVLREPNRLKFAYYEPTALHTRVLAPQGIFSRLDRPLKDLTRPLLWCEPTDSIRAVAQQMTDTNQSCAVFCRGGQFGIVTDADFRSGIAAGTACGDAPIESIASIPALSVTEEATVSTAFLYMVDKAIHHLITTDASGRPVGVARVVDIAATDVRDPLVARNAIGAAETHADLVHASGLLMPTVIDLWHAGTPALHLSAVLSTMVEALVRRTVEIHAPALLDELECCWLLVGSYGRREPLLNSDVDTALIWRLPTDHALTHTPTRRDTATAAEFLARALVDYGLLPCPKGLNASNELFSRSVTDWRDAADSWRQDPHSADNLLLASTMLDARAFGEHQGLAAPLHTALTSGTGWDNYVRAVIGFAGTERPPFGFVREFVIEHFGERKGHLNIKKAGLRPIAALARALALRTGDASGSTTTRLDRAHASGLLTSDEADTLKGTFTLFYQLTLESQIRSVANDEPIRSAIEPGSLDTFERRSLRTAFRSVNQVQDRLSANRHATGGS